MLGKLFLMIQASKRQNTPSPDHLTAHKRIARQKLIHYKLTAASLLSSIVSLTLWLAGLSLFMHLIGILVSFLIGLFYPVKGSIAWAQKHISKTIGQSYQTSLEYAGQLPYDLDDALFKYTKRALNKLEPPHFKRWWLPLMVVSLGLTLLPYSPFRSLPRTVGIPGIDGTPFSETPTQEQTITESTPESPEANQEQSPNQLESQETGRPQTLDDAPGSNSQSLSDLAENVADEEALSRFLDNMREQEIANQPERPDEPPPTTPEPNSAQGNPNEEGDTEGNQNSQNGQTNEQESAEQDQGQGEQTQSGEEASPGETDEGQNPEASDSSSQANDSNEPQSEDQGVASSGEQPDSQGPTQNSPNEAEEEGADGSGINSSASRESLGLNNEEPLAEPEFLQGQISQGESNLAGTVRLPGSTNQEPGSFGPTAEGFQRAEEQAVTEGRIPIEYQEIIKNYFR